MMLSEEQKHKVLIPRIRRVARDEEYVVEYEGFCFLKKRFLFLFLNPMVDWSYRTDEVRAGQICCTKDGRFVRAFDYDEASLSGVLDDIWRTTDGR